VVRRSGVALDVVRRSGVALDVVRRSGVALDVVRGAHLERGGNRSALLTILDACGFLHVTA
jgi:hypothetical protein